MQLATMYFVSDLHKSRFVQAIKPHLYQQGHQQFADQEYSSALYLLTSPLLWNIAEPYIHQNRISFDDLLHDGSLSSGEALLVKLAGNLFNGQLSVNPVDFVILDSGNFAMALTAIQLRYKPLRID